jgi:hypothetical protein
MLVRAVVACQFPVVTSQFPKAFPAQGDGSVRSNQLRKLAVMAPYDNSKQEKIGGEKKKREKINVEKISCEHR